MKLKKKKGSIEMFISSLILITVSMIIVMSIKLREIKITKNLVEDGLVAATLASATVDLREYGATKRIVNRDFDKSFNDFTVSLKDNLKLDDNYKPINSRIICSKVNIENFIIYNISDNDIEVTRRSSDGSIEKSIIYNGVGSENTPDGVLIQTTTIYSKIAFKLKGYMNTEYDVYKEKSVDITDN
jgi:hypothetical protein